MPDDKNRDDSAPADGVAGAVRTEAASPRRRRLVRRSLLVLGPLLVATGGAFVYMNSGRYVETDNAYVKSDSVLINAEVAGPVKRVAVLENERVDAGDILFEIDDAPYRILVERGESQLAAAESFIESLEASYEQQLEQLELARIDIAYYEREFQRQQELVGRRLGTEADVDEARHDLDVAKQQIPIIEQSLAQLRAQIGGKLMPGSDGGRSRSTVGAMFFDGNAAYRTVKSMLEEAKLDLEHTVVRAPFDGVVSGVPTVGHFAAPGSPVMALVADQHLWIEANYKETQLTHVEPSQAVVIRIDAYPGHEWRGNVETISPAAGSEFAVIPAQNASGNWVKVAQRIPVRIRVDARPGDPQLRAGMSATVEIDTGFQRQAPRFLGFLGALKTSTIAEVALAPNRN